jgi:hypothetical protein
MYANIIFHLFTYTVLTELFLLYMKCVLRLFILSHAQDPIYNESTETKLVITLCS